jgi:glycerol-3-phosphate acyltransferase PlsY
MLAVSFALYWPIGLGFALVWLAVFAITRISSAGGMSAALAAPAAAILLGEPRFLSGLAMMAAVVLWRHRANIGRILNGTEPRVGQRRKAA